MVEQRCAHQPQARALAGVAGSCTAYKSPPERRCADKWDKQAQLERPSGKGGTQTATAVLLSHRVQPKRCGFETPLRIVLLRRCGPASHARAYTA